MLGEDDRISSSLQKLLAVRLRRLQTSDLGSVVTCETPTFTHKLELQLDRPPGSSSASTGSCPPVCLFPAEVLNPSYRAQLRSKVAGNIHSVTLVPFCDYPLWPDIAGCAGIQEALLQGIKGLARKETQECVLLHGPPGVGKTLIGRAACNEAAKLGFRCFWPTAADLMSKYTGESERLLRALFALAREKAPSLLIFDEIDSLIRKRSDADSDTERRMKAEFLHQMENMHGILLVGITNMPWELDSAALKQFKKRILVPMPDMTSRKELLLLRLGETWRCSEEEMRGILEETKGFSGSDLEIVCNEALLRAVKAAESAKYVKKVGGEEDQCWVPCGHDDPEAVGNDQADFLTSGARVGKVTAALFLSSLRNSRPTVLPSKLSLYTQFHQHLGGFFPANGSAAPTQVLSYFC